LTIGKGIQLILRDSGVPGSMMATRIEILFRDIVFSVSKNMCKAHRNVFKNNSKRFGAVESPSQKAKVIGKCVSKDWVKDRDDKRKKEETYSENLIRAMSVLRDRNLLKEAEVSNNIHRLRSYRKRDCRDKSDREWPFRGQNPLAE
jgi:hypothetical protein